MTNDPDNDIKVHVANLELQIAELRRMCASLVEGQREVNYRLDIVVDSVNMARAELATASIVAPSRSRADVPALRAIIGGKANEPNRDPPA